MSLHVQLRSVTFAGQSEVSVDSKRLFVPYKFRVDKYVYTSTMYINVSRCYVVPDERRNFGQERLLGGTAGTICTDLQRKGHPTSQVQQRECQKGGHLPKFPPRR